MVIIVAAVFAVQYTFHRTLDKITGQLVFGRDMILPVNHEADWRYIRQRKQTQINKDLNSENNTIIDHNYRVGYTATNKKRSAYKLKTLFKGRYEIVQTWTNGTVK